MSIQSISSIITRLNKELADITHRMSLEQKKQLILILKLFKFRLLLPRQQV